MLVFDLKLKAVEAGQAAGTPSVTMAGKPGKTFWVKLGLQTQHLRLLANEACFCPAWCLTLC